MSEDERRRLRAEVAALRQRCDALELRATHDDARLLEAVLDSVSDLVLVADDHGRCVDANAAACKALGRSREALLGRSLADLAQQPPEAWAQSWRSLLASGTLQGELVARRPDGTPRTLELEARARIVPSRHLFVLRDVTDERRTGRYLRELFDSELIGALEICRDGRLLRLNPSAQRWLGLSPEAVAAGNIAWPELFAPDQRQRVRAQLEGFCHSDQMVALETECLARDGRRVPVLMSSAGHDPERGNCTIVLVDMSDRRRAEHALAHTSEILDGLVSASPAAIFALDAEGRVELWNPAAEWLLGCPAADVLGHPLPLEITWRDRDRASNPLREAYACDVVLCEPVDGPPIEMLLSTAPRTDPDGHVIGTTAILIDISEQRRLEARLAEGQRMEAIGRLAGGVAHDLNNVLTAIQGFAGLLGDSLLADDPRSHDVDEIVGAAERAAQLTRQLLAFARRQVLEPTRVEPDEVVRGLEPMLRRLLPADIELTVVTRAPGCCIHVDRLQLEQVLLNLVLNARDAMPRGGDLYLESTTTTWLGEDSAAPLRGPCCCIIVRDSGQGMDASVLPHIFEPFFTTRQLGEGTGLGLATVHGIVRQSGGHIEVDSTPGAGSTFRVFLPMCVPDLGALPVDTPAPAALHSPPPPVRRARGPARNILLVEDEEAVRRLTARLLRQHGYVVHEASGIEEARRLAADPELALDLVLSDVVLRDGDGVTLAHELRDRLGVLLMSGYPGGRKDAATIPLDDDLPLIHKPFTVSELLEQLRAVEQQQHDADADVPRPLARRPRFG